MIYLISYILYSHVGAHIFFPIYKTLNFLKFPITKYCNLWTFLLSFLPSWLWTIPSGNLISCGLHYELTLCKNLCYKKYILKKSKAFDKKYLRMNFNIASYIN